MWKEFIKGYSISDSGEVRNDETERILKHSVNSRGLHRVTIKNKHYAVHRLLAEVYIPNPNNYPNVILKDGDKEHLTSKNVEWSIEQYVNALQHPKDRKTKNIKLTNGMVKAIQMNKKTSANTLASMYKVSLSTIYKIRKGINLKRFD